MKASSGQHYPSLDHVRALAAFLVFAWHFVHGREGFPVPFAYTPVEPFTVLLDEGNTGVALFVTLSGYLFAKLLDGRKVDCGAFLWNRFLRLAPLLVLVLAARGLWAWVLGNDVARYAWRVLEGAVLPVLPNGGWSLTVEIHFYLILPFLLAWSRRWRPFLPTVVLVALALRACLYSVLGEVQGLAYWTIVGRIDQFVLGMACFEHRDWILARPRAVALLLAAFLLQYWAHAAAGGFQGPTGIAPSRDAIWIALPALEGIAYGAAVTFYDGRFRPRDAGLSRFVARIGAYSYSIYLLHFFFVFRLARFIHEHVADLSSYYVACLWSLACFLATVPIGWLSFRYVESPFLGLRTPYARS